MEKINGEGLKKIQLEILDVVHEFCVKNGIKYWLDCGTLLGAIRHKGYIPWDDDIDLGMLRPDYEKFLKEFNNFNKKYQVKSIVLDKSFPFAHAKVLDVDTVLYEPDEKGNKFSINIDVFVYDNTPDDNKVLYKQYAKRDKYRLLHGYRNYKKKGRSKIKDFAGKVVRTLLSVLPRNYFIKKIDKNAKKYAKLDAKYVGNFTSYSKMCCAKNVFDEIIEVEFENKLYKAPKDYDAWLKSFYGDYMQLPPEDKRVSHHSFVAFVKD